MCTNNVYKVNFPEINAGLYRQKYNAMRALFMKIGRQLEPDLKGNYHMINFFYASFIFVNLILSPLFLLADNYVSTASIATNTSTYHVSFQLKENVSPEEIIKIVDSYKIEAYCVNTKVISAAIPKQCNRNNVNDKGCGVMKLLIDVENKKNENILTYGIGPATVIRFNQLEKSQAEKCDINNLKNQKNKN